LVPAWNAEDRRHAGPGLARRSSEAGAIACGAALVLDLPRLARRAGAWREDLLFASIAESIEIGLEGLLALRDFQREVRDPEAPRARQAFAVAPAGLAEALALLGDGELREDQAARLLAFLVEASERLGREQRVELVLAPEFAERAAERFARLDALAFRVQQPWLFAEGPAASAARPRSYATGLEGLSEPILCAVLGALPTGAPRLGGQLAYVGGLGRLARLRGRTRGGARALYALPGVFPHPRGTHGADAVSDLHGPHGPVPAARTPADEPELFDLPASTTPRLPSDT
jgi:hypothetical protein